MPMLHPLTLPNAGIPQHLKKIRSVGGHGITDMNVHIGGMNENGLRKKDTGIAIITDETTTESDIESRGSR